MHIKYCATAALVLLAACSVYDTQETLDQNAKDYPVFALATVSPSPTPDADVSDLLEKECLSAGEKHEAIANLELALQVEQTHLQNLNQQRNNIEADIENLYDDMAADTEGLSNEREELQEDLVLAQGSLQNCQGEAHCNALQEEVNDLQSQIDAINADIDAITGPIEDQIATRQGLIAEVDDQINEARLAISFMEIDLEELRNKPVCDPSPTPNPTPSPSSTPTSSPTPTPYPSSTPYPSPTPSGSPYP